MLSRSPVRSPRAFVDPGPARFAESRAEIDGDLTRIEAQLDLAVDSAGLRGKNGASITALDQTYSSPVPQSRKVAE